MKYLTSINSSWDIFINKLLEKLRQVSEHPGAQKYIFNTSWMFFEQGLRLLAGLFVGAWMARYLGPESYGLFSYALAYYFIFQAAGKLGLDDIIIKSLIEKPETTNKILGTSFWLKFLSSFVFVAIMIFAIFISDEDPKMRLYVGIVSIGLIFRSFEVTDFY